MKKIFVLFVLTLAYGCANALEAGLYYIRSVINKNYVIDNNAQGIQDGNNLHLWEFNGSVAQQWIVVPNADGSYLFINPTYDLVTTDVNTWHVMDLNGSGIYNGNNIHLWKFNDTKAQLWYLKKNNDGSYTIQSSINRNYVVDLNDSGIYNGNNIQLWESNGTNAQKWIFESIPLD